MCWRYDACCLWQPQSAVESGGILNHSMAINVVKARAHIRFEKKGGGENGHVTRAHLCLKGLRVCIWHTYTHTYIHMHTRVHDLFFFLSLSSLHHVVPSFSRDSQKALFYPST